MAVSFLLFVALGSVALVFWLQATARRESEHVFKTLAQTNAQFVKSTHLPMNERVAEPLGRVLNMRMFFRNHSIMQPSPAPASLAMKLNRLSADNGIVNLGGGEEAIAVTLEPGVDLLLVRPAERTLDFLTRPATLALLGIFWLLSFALAWSVTRGLVRPLRLLAARLPHIADDAETSLPGAEREDEIGAVARAYLATRAQLAAERERRIVAERFALLGRMATGLAHEIHNPLSAIRLHAQLLNAAPPSARADACAESAPVLLSEATRIESLVNQWMFLARPAPPQVARAELRGLLAQVLQTHAALARHAGVEISLEVPGEIFANVDQRRLTQALSNLVLNAIQAMPGGGRLEIRAACDDAIRLSFRDDGGGFSPTALARYAELFYSEKEGGMGIGLNVSSEILKAHGGALQVANAPGHGALVTLVLPFV